MIKRLCYLSVMLLFLFLPIMKEASAFTCRTSDGGVIPPGGSQTPVSVRVSIGPNFKDGKNEISSLAQVTCKNDVSNWTDYLEITTAFIYPAFANGLVGGVTINGVDHDLNSPAINKPVLSVTGLNTVKVPMDLYIKLNKKPSRDFRIKKGELIAEVNFYQTNSQAGCPQCGPYRWNLIADNDAYFSTTTCNINGAKQINVDFGRISQDSFTENPNDAIIKKEQDITYWCEDNTATQDILVRLVSGTSGFSSEAIRTTNSNIGVAMMHNGKVVRPNETFRTQIRNGVGSDILTFVPIKSRNPSANISTGPFSGSATLIFSVP
ncbi:fimbrial protein [Serratia ureilytica]|uniref:fimbrial protein n=1 Tax=Serratia ureilytica TaxID=300181 RepID=UPI00313BBC44